MKKVLLSLIFMAAISLTAFSQIFPKGSMAQAYNFEGGPFQGHVQFDVDDALATMTQKSSFSISGSPAGGEYYNGVWYFTTVDMMFYAIDCETGEVLMETPTNQFVVDMAYDYSTHTMYGSRSAVLYTLDLATGQFTQLFPLTGLTQSSLHTMAIDLEGTMYGIEYSTGDLYQVDKSTGACTLIGSTGVRALFVQTMGFDHNTGNLYWCQTVYNTSGNFYQVNPQTAEITLLASNVGRMTSFFVPYTASTDVADAPTNFNVIADPDLNLSATLSWTNPSVTIGGNPLENINSIEIVRNNEVIHSIANPVAGETMTWVDNTIPIAGAYDYQIYAVTTAGHGYSAILNDVVIGSTCTITVLMYDETGGGWNRGAITFVDDDEIVRGRAALVTGSEGTVDVVLPLGMNIHCVWNPGLFDEFCSFILTNYAGKEIYVSEGTPQAGTFFSFTNNCNQNVPAECTDFSAIADPDGELLVNLSWTNPSTTFLGDPLTDLTSVVITRDNEVIQIITNPVIGGEETFVDDDIINPDIYSYCVYGVNSNGEGAVLCETIEVGKFFFMPTEGSMVINTCSGVLYDDGGPYQNYSNSVTSMTIIFPENNNQKIEITGTYELEEGFDFLYVFEGAGIEGSLISTYTGEGGLYNKSTSGALTLLFASDATTTTSGFMAEIHCVENIGIEEETASFKAYPNPANDFISIEGEETFDQISIYNTLGQLITITDNKVISTSEMVSGVYILKITTATGNTISKKIIVKH